MHDALDRGRLQLGFLPLAEMLELAGRNVILDPHSTLISRTVRLGDGNVFYPGVVVQCDEGSAVTIGDGTTFYPSTLIIAQHGGEVRIGDRCLLGPGGVQIKANQPGVLLRVGHRVRLLNGAEIVGASALGDGTQIIGQVAAQGVRLAGGQDHTGADPDARGAVLKGFGLARNITLDTGEVLNGAGDFAAAVVERQLAYHPRPAR